MKRDFSDKLTLFIAVVAQMSLQAIRRGLRGAHAFFFKEEASFI